MRKILYLLVFALFCGGCDIVSWIITPGPYDRKITAEFKIKDRADEKVMVFVDQIGGGDVGLRVRKDLGDAVSTLLVSRAGVNRKYLVASSELDAIRQGGYLNSSPSEVVSMASKAGAGLVLYTRILDHKLSASRMKGYYTGSLDTGSVILDCQTGKVVWPVNGGPKVVRMEVAIESKGREATVEKLLTSTAHGIVRHLYNIRVRHFRTSLEKVTSGSWD